MEPGKRNSLRKYAVSFLAGLFFFLSACNGEKQKNTEKRESSVPRDYVAVGKLMDSISAPYVIDVRDGLKRLVFIGCVHEKDSMHPQFKLIEEVYADLKPQIAFNEGGEIPDDMRFSSFNEAIRIDGETGVNKFCADRLGIKLLNGDTPDSLEFVLNARRNDVRKLFVYYVVERMAIPYKYGAYGDMPFKDFYEKVYMKWFKNYPLLQNEKTFEKFKGYYKNYTGRSFLLDKARTSFDQDSLDIEAFDYVNDSCEFCAIGRTSKTLRDSILITKLKEAFKTQDRILVTFGHGHALALEPVLRNIFK